MKKVIVLISFLCGAFFVSAQQGKRVCDRMIPFQFFVFRVANILLFLGFAK